MFLLDVFPNNNFVRSYVSQEILSSLVFEEMGSGSYFLKLSGEFLSLRKDQGNPRVVYIGINNPLKGRVEFQYNIDYSRTYWNKAYFNKNQNKFVNARHFSDPTGLYPDWYVVGEGYTYLAEGDLIELNFLVDEDTKEKIEGTRGASFSDGLRDIPIYFLFAEGV